MRVILAMMVLYLAGCGGAAALEIRGGGGATAWLVGPIEPGDDAKVREFFKTTDGSKVRVLYLKSPGGRVREAQEIARMVRKAGLKTVVDAQSDFCASACTGIFIAGVSRHYLNARDLKDGLNVGNTGLAFHEGSNSPAGYKAYSSEGTAIMANTYNEMGVPAATGLLREAGFDKVYRVSGGKALSLGVATSLSPP